MKLMVFIKDWDLATLFSKELSDLDGIPVVNDRRCSVRASRCCCSFDTFAKYFCAWLRICADVLVGTHLATFFHSRPYTLSPFKNVSCSAGVHRPETEFAEHFLFFGTIRPARLLWKTILPASFAALPLHESVTITSSGWLLAESTATLVSLPTAGGKVSLLKIGALTAEPCDSLLGLIAPEGDATVIRESVIKLLVLGDASELLNETTRAISAQIFDSTGHFPAASFPDIPATDEGAIILTKLNRFGSGTMVMSTAIPAMVYTD